MSILPRILFGLVLVLTIYLTKKYIKNNFFGAVVSFSISTLFHTIFVMTAIFYLGPIFYPTLFSEFFPPNFPIWQVLFVVLTSNGIFEILAAVLIAAPVAVRISAANPFSEA